MFRLSMMIRTMGVPCVSALLLSCTADQFRKYTRPTRLYVERTTVATDFDPRVLSSDGEGFTLGISYDLGVLLSPEPLSADSLIAALEQWRPSIEQNVTVGQRQDGASEASAKADAAASPATTTTFIPPVDAIEQKEKPNGWLDPMLACGGLAALLASAAGVWHKVKGLPGTRRRKNKQAFRKAH